MNLFTVLTENMDRDNLYLPLPSRMVSHITEKTKQNQRVRTQRRHSAPWPQGPYYQSCLPPAWKCKREPRTLISGSPKPFHFTEVLSVFYSIYVPLSILGHSEIQGKGTLEKIREVCCWACDPLSCQPVGTSGFSNKFPNEVQGRYICPTILIFWKSLSAAKLLAIHSMLYFASGAIR